MAVLSVLYSFIYVYPQFKTGRLWNVSLPVYQWRRNCCVIHKVMDTSARTRQAKDMPKGFIPNMKSGSHVNNSKAVKVFSWLRLDMAC